MNPSFSRILTRTRFAPYALGQAPLLRNPNGLTRIYGFAFLLGWLPSLRGHIRASQPDADLLLQFLVSLLRGLDSYFRWIPPYVFWGFVSRRVGYVVRHAYKLVVGRPRIARGAPWAGSITGGEACGYPCSEKEGFKHPSLWRAPCFWGTHE